MFFTQEDKQYLHKILEEMSNLSARFEKYEKYNVEREIRYKETLEINLQKLEQNVKKVNEMTLELKGVVSTSRAALSERNVFDDFIKTIEKHLLNLVKEGEKKNSKKIDEELHSLRKMINNLNTNYEGVPDMFYTRLTQFTNTLERIEDTLEINKKPTKKKSKD